MNANQGLRISALVAFSALMMAAHADTPATPTSSNTDLEEIVVTARLRSESLQEVPESVTAFSAKALVDAGVRDYNDFVALTPNVSLVEAESVGQSFLTIRGLTEVRNGQAPVAFVVDGVQESSNRQFTQTMFDLDSVQILMGPPGGAVRTQCLGRRHRRHHQAADQRVSGLYPNRRRLRRRSTGPGGAERADRQGSTLVPDRGQLQ